MARLVKEVFDEVERDVLDRVKHQHCLLSRGKSQAMAALTGAFAKGLFDLRVGRLSRGDSDSRAQEANRGLRGLAHCVRWVNQCCPGVSDRPTPDAATLEQEALGLLGWGAEYDPIWNQHSAYRGGLVAAEVNEPAKTITFLQSGAEPRFFVLQRHANKAVSERSDEHCPFQQLADIFERCSPTLLSGDGATGNTKALVSTGAIDVATEWMAKTVLPEMPPAAVIGPVSIADLRRVLGAVYALSLFLRFIEDGGGSRDGRPPVVGPIVNASSTAAEVDHLCGLSGAPQDAVRKILAMLTFDPENPHVTLAQQPYIADGDTLYLVPSLIPLLDLSHMCLSAFNADEGGRLAYSTFINDLESTGRTWMASEMRTYLPADVEIVENKTFKLKAGGEITPDFVLSSNGGEVLIMDAKYAMPPFGPLAVRYDLRESKEWTKRMSDYVSAFQNTPGLLAQHFKTAVHEKVRAFGLILLRWPFPVPIDFPENMYGIDWPSLRDHLRSHNSHSRRDIFAWARARPELALPDSLEWRQKSLIAGNWTYQYFVPVPSAAKTE